jgi:gliding motility-associated-like protein
VKATGCPDASATIKVIRIDCSCPVFSGGNVRLSSCLNERLPEFVVPTDAKSTYRVVFKYFGSRQADPLSVYSGGITMGSVVPNGSNANYNAGLPGNTGSLPDSVKKYFVYAHLDPLPLNPLCRPVQEWEISLLPLPVVNAGVDKEIIEGEKVLLQAKAEGYTSLTWTPSSTLSAPAALLTQAFPLITTNYSLTATSGEGCKVSDDVLVKVYLPIDIPNVFSPNGDGIHDRWLLKNIEQFPNSRMQIFSRYGELLFEKFAYGTSNAWDGTRNGKPLLAGVYFYVLAISDKRSPISGTITILR